MLTLLKHIRILVLDGPGHGDQAASLHLFKSIKFQGFTGLTDLIYEDSIAHKIKTIYELPLHFNAKTLWHDTDLNIRFISLSAYRSQAWESADFGFMAASPIETYNIIAEFLGVKAVLSFSPYAKPHCFSVSSPYDGQWLNIYSQGRFIPMPCEPAQLPIKYPAPTFDDALTLLSRQHAELPNSLATQNLLQLFEAIGKQEIIAWPVYGLHKHFGLPIPTILVRLMLVIQALHKQQSWDKPVVLMLFNHLPPTLWEDIAQIQTALSQAYPEQEQTPAFIQDLFAAFNRSISLSIHANHTSTALTALEPSQIAFIEIGRTSATAFEALFTHRSSFILPPIIEGANAKSLLEQYGLPWLSHNRGGCSVNKLEFLLSPEKARDIANCAFSANASLSDPEHLTTNQDIIGILIAYINAVNDPLSDIHQRLQTKLTGSDRYTAGIQWALSQVTSTPDNASIHAALRTLLQHRQWELIKDFIETHDITGWDDTKSRLFLWSLLYEGHSDVFLALPGWQLNHTLMHIPQAIIERFMPLHVRTIHGLVSRNKLHYTDASTDVTFSLSMIIGLLRRIQLAQTMTSSLTEHEYTLLLMLNQNTTAISLASKQSDFKNLLLACMQRGLLEMLSDDILSLSQKIDILNNLSKYEYSAIFKIITPALILAWQDTYPEKLANHTMENIPSLLINQHLNEIMGMIGPIPLQEKFDFPHELFLTVGRFSAHDLIERITLMLHITPLEIHKKLFNYMITHLLIMHDQDTCATLFNHFNLTSTLVDNIDTVFSRSVKPENFFVALNMIGCEPLARYPSIHHFMANSFTRGRCELIYGLSQQCPELPQIKHYESLCQSINTTSAKPTAPLPTHHTETQASWLTQLDQDYPGPYSFGFSFLRGLLTPALERHYSPQMSAIMLSTSILLLGALFQDVTLIMHGLFSIAFTLLLPSQSLAPIALLCASLLRDLCYSDLSATEILITQGTRMVGSIGGHWSGQGLGQLVFGATKTQRHREHQPMVPTTEM